MMLASGCWNHAPAPINNQNLLGFSGGETIVWCLAKDSLVSRHHSQSETSPGSLPSNEARWRSVFRYDGSCNSELERADRYSRRERSPLQRSFVESWFQECAKVSDSREKLESSVVFWRDGSRVLGRSNDSRGPSFLLKGKIEHIILSRSTLSSNSIESSMHAHEERLRVGRNDETAAQLYGESPSQGRRTWNLESNKNVTCGEGGSGERTAERGLEEKEDFRLPREISSAKQKSGGNTTNNNGEDWKCLSEVLTAGQTFPFIPNHELKKLAELRFTGDMRNGDSAEQVLLLQKVMFWLDQLLKESHITGYFGMETKEAVKEFQEAHGAAGTGFWGSLSKQALWHNISDKILHRVKGDEKARQISGQNLILKMQAARKSDIGIQLSKVEVQIWQTIQKWNSEAISNAFSSTIPGGDWKLLSGKVGIFVLVCGALLGVLNLKSSFETMSHRQSLKRRILRSQWYGEPLAQTRAERFRQKGRSDMNKYHSVGELYEDNLFHLQSLSNQAQNAYRKSTKQLDRMPKTDGDALKGSSTPDLEVDWDAQYDSEGSVGQFRRRKKVTSALLPTSLTSRERWSMRNSPDFLFGKHDSSARLLVGENFQYQRVFTGDIPNRGTTNNPFKKDEWERRIQRHAQTSELTNTQRKWREEDELDLKLHVEELHRSVQAAEQNRYAAMRALAEEKQRSLELEVKISRQREAAVALEEEVRVLKESHDALLASLRKKYSSSAAARAAADLLYQNWDSDSHNPGQEATFCTLKDFDEDSAPQIV